MIRKGRGMATIMFGFGYGEGFPDHSTASISVETDGRILLKTAAADVGQGVLTTITQIAAEVLKIDPGMIELLPADTHLMKNAGSTSATRQTYFTGNAVKQAAEKLLAELYHYACLELNCSHPGLEIEEGLIFKKGGSGRGLSYREVACLLAERGKRLEAEASFFPRTDQPGEDGQAERVYVAYTFMTQFVELEVDTGTGLIEVVEINTALDLGKAINPVNVEGQIEGGTVMGLGMALMEEQVIREGITLNPDLTDYLIPTALDIPRINACLIEKEDADGPYGSKGIGEPVTIATAPAIANAVYDAIGVRFYSLPITPEKVLAALAEGEKNVK